MDDCEFERRGSPHVITGLAALLRMFQYLLGGKSISFDRAHPYSELPLLLVSGFARSGTTVLRKSFAAHSQIHSNDRESNIIQEICAVAQRSSEHPNHVANRLVTESSYWRLFQNLVLFLGWPEPRSNVQGISTYSSMTSVSMNGLLQMFPGSFICYLIRNGVEVVSSHMNFAPFRTNSFQWICREWRKHADFAVYGQSLNRCLLIRHEGLLNEQQTTKQLSTALAQVGLGFEKSCLHVILAKSFHPTSMPGESATDAMNRAKRIDRWKYWTDEQRHIFETECSAAMELLGYRIPWQT